MPNTVNLACFTCRKVFKKGRPDKDVRLAISTPCTQCGYLNLWQGKKPDQCANCDADLESNPRKIIEIQPIGTADYGKCPQCGGRLRYVGIRFKAPKQNDRELWAVAQKLIEAGILYQGKRGSGKPGPRPTRLRDVDKFIAEYEVKSK